jgi:septum formation protein
MKLQLASASMARRQMLEAAGVPFELSLPKFDEDGVKASLRAQGLGAADLALALAEAKACAVPPSPNFLVLGADQTLELDDGTMLDKPASRDDLAGQLRRLSGRTHRLHAAAVLAEAGNAVWRDVESVTLHVRPLGEAFLSDYLDREYDTVRWSVGGYHIEGRGAQLFERIDGSLFAVRGLPLLPLLAALRERGMTLK